MSNVWQTRYRLLLEQLEALADQLSANEPIPQPVLEDQTGAVACGCGYVAAATPTQQPGPVQLLRVVVAVMAKAAAVRGVPVRRLRHTTTVGCGAETVGNHRFVPRSMSEGFMTSVRTQFGYYYFLIPIVAPILEGLVGTAVNLESTVRVGSAPGR